MTKIMIIILVSFFLSSSLIAEDIKIDDKYEIFITKSSSISMENISIENVFFGRYDEWVKKETESLKSIKDNMANGFSSGASVASNGVANSVGNATGKAVGQGLGMGLGIGLAFGLLDMGAQVAMKDEVFILVKDITNKKGEKTRIFGFICANSFDDEKIIKDFLEQEILKKYKI